MQEFIAEKEPTLKKFGKIKAKILEEARKQKQAKEFLDPIKDSHKQWVKSQKTITKGPMKDTEFILNVKNPSGKIIERRSSHGSIKVDDAPKIDDTESLFAMRG